MNRLAEFMAKIATETYPEPVCEMHTELTKQAMDRVWKHIFPCNQDPYLWRDMRVLDVGCGQGPALRIFNKQGCHATGIALNIEDIKVCREGGFSVLQMDQNDLAFKNESFQLVWARHVLEHSIAPLWTLTEFHRVLKPGCWLYAEMPGPDTACMHHVNKNHYSVLGANAWGALMNKAGFLIVDAWATNLNTQAGPDVYFSFIGRKG